MDVRTQNAIRWIDALKPEAGFKKTVHKLKKTYKPNLGFSRDYLTSERYKDQTRYCCLGVACEVLGREINVGDYVSIHLMDDVGLKQIEGQLTDGEGKAVYVYAKGSSQKFNYLTVVNDDAYPHDDDFSNIREFILDNIEFIFISEVARGLKEHFKN